MKTIVQVREFINGDYKGLIYEKIIPLSIDDSFETAWQVGEIIREAEYFQKVLDNRYYENFNPVEYAKTAKPINLKQFAREA